MSLFFVILLKVFPIYINVVLGFLSSKMLNVQRESVATLLIYILGPMLGLLILYGALWNLASESMAPK